MDDNQIEGAFQEAAGKIEETVGDIAGDAKTQVSGKARQVSGRVQQTYGQVVGGVREFAAENPIGAVVGAAGLGILLGLILTRR
jgi:uncharacterized protein YjbJ (UPF0337 family)